MIKTTLKVGFKPIKIKGVTFTAQQNALIAQFGLKDFVDERTRGIGPDVSQMPRLSGKAYLIMGKRGVFVRKGPPYEMWKAKHGLEPIRDLVGVGQGGHMMENLSVRYADDNGAKIAFTSRMARIKAQANEKRVPFMWWSSANQERIAAYAAKVFDAAVKVFAEKFRQMRKAA